MKVREAVERADRLRQGNRFEEDMKHHWLRELDGQLRELVVEQCECAGEFADIGADVAMWDDGLEDDVELLVPAPYDAVYAHYLAAQMDLALGETDRYMNEKAQADGQVSDWAAAMRRKHMPRRRTQWRW